MTVNPVNITLQPMTVNPVDITLQPSPMAPLHNFPVFNFDFNNNDSPRSPDLNGSDTTESGQDELDGKDRNEGRHDSTAERDSDGPDVIQPDANHLGEGQSDGHSTGSDSADDMDVSSNYGPPKSKKTTQASGAGDTNTLTKRHRLSSPIPSKKLGEGQSDGHSTGSDSDDMDVSSNYGSPKSKETTQASGAGDMNALTKRRRLSSPIPPKKLGSKQNPIDVDSVTSLFEPMVLREYVGTFIFQSAFAENMLQVKKEKISLPLEMNPPIKGNRSYTVFDVTGKLESFTPSFHVCHY